MGTLFAFPSARRIIKAQRFREVVKAGLGRGRGSDAAERDEGEVMPVGDGTLMRYRLLRVVAVFVAMSVAARIIAAVISRRLTLGDEDSDEFQLASIMGGREFHSHAEHLRSGTAITSLGGMELDLREATLDPTGASLELRTTMGGIEVRVPEYWSIEVDQETLGGELEVDVPAPEDLPEDAPKLHIHAVTRMGGGHVTARTA